VGPRAIFASRAAPAIRQSKKIRHTVPTCPLTRIKRGWRRHDFDQWVGAQARPWVIDCRTCFVPHPCLPAFGRMNQYGFDALTRPVNSAMR
jgi:hypothetical protein